MHAVPRADASDAPGVSEPTRGLQPSAVDDIAAVTSKPSSRRAERASTAARKCDPAAPAISATGRPTAPQPMRPTRFIRDPSTARVVGTSRRAEPEDSTEHEACQMG